ncbi:MAG: threonine/serine exporter family protein, partial [Clostridia bacterium]|nr:threonine/serine exporter family protein [Clostridia bacterium]
MGEELMSCGAEVNRVEDTIARMGMAFGAVNMNVFVITTSIVVTM